MPNFIRFFDKVSLKPLVDAQKIKDFYSVTQNATKPLRIRVAATHAGKITRNNGFYLPHKMKLGAKTFIDQYQKPVQVHHGDEVDPIGRIVSAQYIDTSGSIKDSWDVRGLKDNIRPISNFILDGFCQGILSQKESIDIIDKYFIRDKSIIDDPDYQGLGYIELVADISEPEAIQKIIDGRYLTGSVGATTNSAICSVCKQDWANDEGRCEHSPGKVYDDAKCVLIAGDLSYDEWSFVNKPADRHSKVIEVNVGGIQDFVTIDDKKKKDRIPEIILLIDQEEDGEITLTTGPGPEDGHVHEVTIDENGNGLTTVADDHRHNVVNFIVQEADGHTHELPESDEIMRMMHGYDQGHPVYHQNKTQEDRFMTFKDAFQRVSKLEFFGGLKGLEDAVKAVLNNKELPKEIIEKDLEKLVADKLGKLQDYESTLKSISTEASVQQDTKEVSKVVMKEISVKDFFGDSYDEIVGDDPWGEKYAEMMFSLLDGVIEDKRAEIEKEIHDAKLSSQARKNLASSTFCGPNRSYPVPDCGHAKSAMAYAKKYNESASVMACIRRKASRLGCPFEDNAMMDSVKIRSEYFDSEYYDKFTDEEMWDMAEGFNKAMKERGLECSGCSEKNEDQIDKLTQLEERLDSARKEIRYLHEDITNLQDALTESELTVRNHKIDRIVDYKKLSGEEIKIEDFNKELQSKPTSELDEVLKNHVGKVDLEKIGDNLKSGLSNIPQGAVQDPTLTVKSKVEVSRETLEFIRTKVFELRMKKNGEELVKRFLADCKSRGLIPDQYPVEG